MSATQDSRSPTPTPAPKTRAATRTAASAAAAAAPNAGTPAEPAHTPAQPPPSQRLRAIQSALDESAKNPAVQPQKDQAHGSLENSSLEKDTADEADGADGAPTTQAATPPGLPAPTDPAPSPPAPEGVDYDELAEEAQTPPARTFWELEDRTPMSPALSNFSIHGAGSCTSSCLADEVGDHLCSGGRLEDLVTDRIDRYGRPLPGYEELQERKRKRLRTEGGPVSPPDFVMRFRKYKEVPTPRTKAQKVANWVPFGHTPPSDSPAPKFVSAETIHAEWLRSQAEEALLRSQAIPQPPHPDQPSNETSTNPSGQTGNARTPPSPHIRDEDYAPLFDRGPGDDRRPEMTGDMEGGEMDVDVDPPRARAAKPTPAGKTAAIETTPTGASPDRDAAPSPPPAGPPAGKGKGRALLAASTPIVPSALRKRQQAANAGPPVDETLAGAHNVQDAQVSAWYDKGELPLVPHARTVAPTLAPAQGPAFAFTPRPIGEFPTIHFANPESLVEGLDPQRVDDFWEEGKRIIFLGLFNVGYPKPGMAAPLTRLLTEALKQITKETDFAVIAPEPPWGVKPPPAKLPRTWAVEGLSDGAADKVTTGYVWSSKQLSFSAHKHELRLPELLITLGPYYQNHGDDIKSSIKGAFKSAQILPRIEDYVAKNEDYMQLDDSGIAAVAMEVAKSVRVEVAEYSPGAYIASVFCSSPCKESEDWLEWREFVKTVPFRTKYNPTRTARPTEVCGYCRGADHVTHTCPFPNIPGWNGPPIRSQTYGAPPAQPANNAAANFPAHNDTTPGTGPSSGGPSMYPEQTGAPAHQYGQYAGARADHGWNDFEGPRGARGRGGRGMMLSGPPRGGYNGRGRGRGNGRPQDDVYY